MKKSQLAQYLHILPLVVFLTLAALLLSSPVIQVLEPPLLLPLLNTVLLSILPFIIAFLAGRTYALQGFPAFLHLGNGMVAFGVGSLVAGWGLLRYGQNFYITVHNVGSLLGGLCHLGAVATLIFKRSAAPARPPRRVAVFSLVTGYSVCALAVLAVSVLTTRGWFPTFFVPGQGPTTFRQVVLAVAVSAYALSAIVVVDLHAQTRETLFRLYASALFLMSIGLGIVLSQRSAGSLLSWTGRASQYAGSLYFMAAMIVGQRQTSRIGVSLPAYLYELLSSHIDNEVRVRTGELAGLNEQLRIEVDERMRAEHQWRRSEERLRLAAEATDFGFYDYNFETGEAYYSAELLKLFGLPPDGSLELDSELVAKAVHPEDRAAFLSAMGAANNPRGSGILDLEHRIVRTDGSLRWLRVRGRTAFHGSGADAGPSHANGIVQDITERKRAELELKEREESYRTAIEASLQGIAIVQGGKIVLCNEALCRMSGYSKEETYRMAPEEVVATVHPEDRRRVFEGLMMLQRGEDVPPAGVIRLLNKTGGLRWVEMLAARSVYRGSPAIQISYVDVTEKRRAEDAYHMIVDHALYGMAILEDGRIIFANRALAELTGYSVPQLLDLSTEQLVASVHEEDREGLVSYMTELLARGEVPPVRTFRFADKAGSERWVEIQSTRTDHDGSSAVQITYKDVSLQKSSEQELKAAHTSMRNLAVHLLHVREEERREIAQEVHDALGQPLAALKMDLHWLQKRLSGSSPAVGERFKGVIELSESAISVAQKIASDLRPRMLDDLGLAPALQQLGADFARRTKIACKVTTDFPRELVGRKAGTTLYRFCQEALANVGVHSHADHSAVCLSAGAGGLVLQVEDDGIGITREQLQAHDSYGLIGLRERIEGLGGSFSIHGESGFGTIVTARIPLPKTGRLA